MKRESEEGEGGGEREGGGEKIDIINREKRDIKGGAIANEKAS